LLVLLPALLAPSREDATLSAAEPVAIRVESLVLLPTQSPNLVVVARNLLDSPFSGILRVEAPAGWQLDPREQPLRLARGETRRSRFLVRKGVSLDANSYPLVASAIGTGGEVTVRQRVATASAPYYKPEVDGRFDDWKDAIFASWLTGGMSTRIGTYWNRRRFIMCVSVEEDQLIPRAAESSGGSYDAVQVAISAEDTVTGSSPDDEAERYEFLFVSTDRKAGRCYLLANPATKLRDTLRSRDLESLVFDDAEIVVRREGRITTYECSVPFSIMSSRIRPSEGRQFFLSVLVHDPDGTGIRDWGEAAGLWADECSRFAWSHWPGAKWGPLPPQDNKTPWGLCSSRY
jgi:hypothetical protein